MTEPQLSAEMEKRFDEEFDHFVLDVGESGETVDWDRVKQFLATALEEQRANFITEVGKLDERCYWRFWYKKEGNASTDYAEGYERCLNDVIAILGGQEQP